MGKSQTKQVGDDRSSEPVTTRGNKKKAKSATSATQKRRRRYLPATERRRLIIQAAQEVFARTNFQGARTRDLAKAADVNEATLFKYFDSKEELFIASIVEPLSELMQGIRERTDVYATAKSVDEILALTKESAKKQLETVISVYFMLVTGLFSDPKVGRKLYCEKILPILKQSAAVKPSVIKNSFDPEFVTLAAFGIYFMIAMDRAFTGKTSDISQLAQDTLELVMFGAANDRLRARDDRQHSVQPSRLKPSSGE